MRRSLAIAVLLTVLLVAAPAFAFQETPVPPPAGGITIPRVGEMLDFYGSEVMLLIAGAHLAARERLTPETAAFVETVKGYRHG